MNGSESEHGTEADRTRLQRLARRKGYRVTRSYMPRGWLISDPANASVSVTVPTIAAVEAWLNERESET